MVLRPNDLHRTRHYAISMLVASLTAVDRGSPSCWDQSTFAKTTADRPVGLPAEALIRRRLVGLTRFELVTPRLSSVCSNQLSYRPGISLPDALSEHIQYSKNLRRFSQN